MRWSREFLGLKFIRGRSDRFHFCIKEVAGGMADFAGQNLSFLSWQWGRGVGRIQYLKFQLGEVREPQGEFAERFIERVDNF